MRKQGGMREAVKGSGGGGGGSSIGGKNFAW